MKSSPTGIVQRVWLARGLAIAVDIVQVTLLPATVEGVFSPVADGLDLAAAAVMTLLVGWHIAFIPSFLVKLLPVADLAPTWTMAVLVATRGRTAKPLTIDSNAPMPSLLPEEAHHAGGPMSGPLGARWKPWYDGLAKPGWTPSSATISLIWTLLYPLIAFSFGWVFLQGLRGRIPGIVALPFAMNLVANLIFTPILFGLKNLVLATLDILVVLGSLVWAILWVLPYSHSIAAAQVPYLVWVCIATSLQIGITLMNRPVTSR